MKITDVEAIVLDTGKHYTDPAEAARRTACASSR